MRLPILAITLMLFACEPTTKNMVQTIDLSSGWTFKNIDSTECYPARIPGTVHTDLLRNNLIAEPFYGCNEKNLQWIERANWQYETQFIVDRNTLQFKHLEIVFDGIDTYAEVFINGKKKLITNNMHRKWKIPCKELLQKGINTLTVNFVSAIDQIRKDSLALGHHIPGGQWAFARKAAYHFGWDWGPRFVTAGIYKPVYLKMWDHHNFDNFYLSTKELTAKNAKILLGFESHSTKREKAILKVTNTANDSTLLIKTIWLNPETPQQQHSFQIENPKYWWSNGLGDPHVYDVRVLIESSSDSRFETILPLAIRTLKTTLQKDSIGQALYVELNGHKTYMKGANYIPSHSFLSEVTHEKYREIIETARNSNMNMLRVWGGGVYENDSFYELCLRNGILIWQDFMFACSMYPYDSAFQQNVKHEAEYQVKRLRKFANIALWCGNNEADEAWHNWGYHRNPTFSKTDSANMGEGYKTIFHKILPVTVATYDSSVFYLSTSPLYGWGREKSMTHGSAHYWGVWWGVKPYETYLRKVPRFMSEFGLQAMPALSTIRAFQPPKHDTLFSPSLQCHQKHPTGYETISKYLKMENLNAQTLEDYIYMSQLVQAKGIGLGIEAQRKAKPRCMGSLYWQINDCWPVTSWSSTDFYGNAKALQYKAEQLFDDIMISVIMQNDSVDISIVSDRLQTVKGNFSINTITTEGNYKSVLEQEINIAANGVKNIKKDNKNNVFGVINFNSNLIEASFETTDGKTYYWKDFLVKIGNIKIPGSKIDLQLAKVPNGYSIKLSTNSLAPYVQLYLTDTHAKFDRNFIHLVPGKTETIFCATHLPETEFQKQLRIKSLSNKVR